MLVASEVMTKRLITFQPHESIERAIDLLVANNISGAPVIDEHGALVGVLSEKDCLKTVANMAVYQLPGGTVAQYMTHDVITVGPNDGLLRITGLFLDNHFRRLPVVDGTGALVGQVSRRDVLRGIQRMNAPALVSPDDRQPT